MKCLIVMHMARVVISTEPVKLAVMSYAHLRTALQNFRFTLQTFNNDYDVA